MFNGGGWGQRPDSQRIIPGAEEFLIIRALYLWRPSVLSFLRLSSGCVSQSCFRPSPCPNLGSNQGPSEHINNLPPTKHHYLSLHKSSGPLQRKGNNYFKVLEGVTSPIETLLVRTTNYLAIHTSYTCSKIKYFMDEGKLVRTRDTTVSISDISDIF